MSLNVMTRGAGSPLLLLHGFTGTARTWRLQLDRWSRDHRVIAPDLLGHGRSEAPTDPARYTLERQASDLVDLLGLLEARPATVIGYSMGARLALVLALRFPDAVERLVVESPSVGLPDPEVRAERRAHDDGLATDIERDGLTAFVDRWEAQPIFASQADLPTETRAELRAERLSHQPTGLAASLRGAGQGAMAPLDQRLTELRAPTLVIAGERDGPGLERAHVVTEAVPDARLDVLREAGHCPHLELPERFGELVTDFISPAQPAH